MANYRFTAILSVGHLIAYPISRADGWLPLRPSAWTAERQRANLFGALSLLALLGLLVTSVAYIRRRHYNVFALTHWLFVAFFALLALHSEHARAYVYVACALYAVDRVLRLALGGVPMRATNVAVVGDDILRVQFPRNFARNYRVGQYVFINFPQVSVTEFHPYTLTSGPDDDCLEVHIKALGDHTRRLLQTARDGIAAGRRLWLRTDGPYGHLSIEHWRYAHVCVVVGGVGVTPGIALLRDCFRVAMSDARHRAVPKRDVTQLVTFVWIVRDMGDYESFREILRLCVERAHMRRRCGDYYAALRVRVFLTRAQTAPPPIRANDSSIEFFVGRPNLRSNMSDVADAARGASVSRVGVVVCGPSALVLSVRAECAMQSMQPNAAARSKRRVRMDVHAERFDF